MASTSLGTLTLDLAVRLSEFTDGLSRAERETRDRTENMGKSVSNFKEKLIDDLSGTPIGGAIDSLNEKLGSITEAFGSGGLSGAATIGAASVIGSVAAIGAGLVALSLETAEADKQLVLLADKANTTTRNLQVLSAAANDFGLDMEGVTDVLADAREKFGEFSATGGGGLVDTLELLQKSTKMTDAELAKFAREITTVDTVDAIQMVENALADANVTTQEARFVNESLASGLDDIAPIFDNYGNLLKEVDAKLEQTGVIRTKESIEQSQILAQQVEDTTIQFNGLKNQLVTATLPAMATLIEYFAEGAKQGGSFKSEISGVGQAINITAASVVGLAAGIGLIVNAFSAVGMQMRNIGQTAQNFFAADSLADRGKALFTGFFSTGVLASGSYLDVTSQWDRDMAAIEQIMSGRSVGSGTSSTNTRGGRGVPFVDTRVSYTPPATTESSGGGKPKTTALNKTANPANYIQYANSGSTRNQRLNSELEQALSFLQEEGIVFKVNSGGQPAKGSGGKRVGSTAHDHGHAADGDLYKDGRKLDWNNSKDLPLLKALVEEAAARGINGIGAGDNYMGAGRFHFGIQQNAAAWGKDGKGANAPDWLKTAHSAGMSRKSSGTFYGKALAQDNKEAEQALREQEKLAAEALRAQEELERAKLSVMSRYASAQEKIETEHTDNIKAIKAAYSEDSVEYARYIADEEADYEAKKNAASQSIMVKYLSEEERLLRNHQLALQEIADANIQDPVRLQEFIDDQNAAYQKDLDNFIFASQAKRREQDKLYQSIANSARANGINSVSTGLDAMAQRTMSADDYAGWRLGQDHDEAYNSVNDQYANRQSEINAVDERGDYALPELERFELLEIAKQEHLDAMWSMEEQYALRQQSLDEQMGATRVAIQQNAFGAMTSVMGMFFGESSRMQQAAFIMERTYATQKALMNVKETYSNTFNAISAIPLIGPYIAMPMATAASAIQVAQAAGIGGMSAPSVAGIAHGGLTNVPEEATYLLQRDERVLSPNQNKDFTDFMNKGRNQNQAPININNNSSAQVSARRQPNGEVTIDMVDKMINKSFRQIGRANSLESKAIQRGTTARVNRL
nr:hypothetical protein [uncultured Psychrobacter sp.]